MQQDIKKYIDNKYVVFSIDIQQKQHKSGKWKKEIKFPYDWGNFTLEKTFINKDYSGLGILTGKINNIIVIDIDNLEHWNKFLQENKEKEPDTIKATSGSGGIHFYFKYNPILEGIKSKDHCFSKEYDIDIKTNGGCVICPPSSYFNKNLNKKVKYTWVTSIFDSELKEMPNWMCKILLDKNKIKQNNKENNIQNNEKYDNYEIIEHENEDNKKIFTVEDITYLLSLLSPERNNNYSDWLNLGICLFNIDQKNLFVWKKWSKQSDKYENGICEEKWKTFKRDKNGLNIGSLLTWCKHDNKFKYEEFIKQKKLSELINSKFPNDNLELGDTVIINDVCSYTHLQNSECLIKGDVHKDLPKSMYIEMLKDLITIKCRHPECFGKIYPCQHIQLSKQEMNIAFNGNVNITINNNTNNDELVDFQLINLFDDNFLNELVFNGLNGESYTMAEIIYYYYKNEFNYGEDENWYVYEEHKWKNIGCSNKNTKLRHLIQPKLKEIYTKLLYYYRDNDNDKNKIKTLRQIIKSFDNTNLKNNIMTELIEIYSENNNPMRNFTKKLDGNKYLIGFDNGIYDLSKFEFREGKFDDYITLSVGYNYNEKHTEKYNELLQFLEDIQPNKDERDYMLTYLSIGLVGNLLELFTILTGCGRNGKSKLIELLKITLGDYFGSVQSQLFTRPRPDANSPDPGLLSLVKKKIVMASEPEKNSKLNSGFIKFITGRDSTTLRNCHSNNMVDFTANFLTFLICNDIPECDDIDNAFSKRLRCINFPTEFVQEPMKENQKKINININENFNLWKSDFILLLIEYYKKYTVTKELKVTPEILQWTDKYKEDTDLYLNFLNECTEQCENNIKTMILYEKFKLWFKVNNPNTKIPNNREFNNGIKKYKTIEKVYYEGISVHGIKKLRIIE
jgi:P4 family phage/plasmid primase-like protien